MTINEELINQLVQRGKADEIVDDDVIAFIANPRRWRPVPKILTVETAQAFWQDVNDELGIKAAVPPVPKLTDKQVKSFKKFGFLPFYVPTITEAQYPVGFVKPDWSMALTAASIERIPLVGKWVAVETIAKPHHDDSNGYADDRLMAAIKCKARFAVTYNELTSGPLTSLRSGLLAKIAKVTGFPKKGTRLPTVEEWNWIALMFNWLREHRQMDLPSLGSTCLWEWCQNAYGSDGRLLVGSSDAGGLAGVFRDWHGACNGYIAFRVLVVL